MLKFSSVNSFYSLFNYVLRVEFFSKELSSWILKRQEYDFKFLENKILFIFSISYDFLLFYLSKLLFIL